MISTLLSQLNWIILAYYLINLNRDFKSRLSYFYHFYFLGKVIYLKWGTWCAGLLDWGFMTLCWKLLLTFLAKDLVTSLIARRLSRSTRIPPAPSMADFSETFSWIFKSLFSCSSCSTIAWSRANSCSYRVLVELEQNFVWGDFVFYN